MVMIIRISGHRDGNADDPELDRLVVMKGFRMGCVLRPLGGGGAPRAGGFVLKALGAQTPLQKIIWCCTVL